MILFEEQNVYDSVLDSASKFWFKLVVFRIAGSMLETWLLRAWRMEPESCAPPSTVWFFLTEAIAERSVLVLLLPRR